MNNINLSEFIKEKLESESRSKVEISNQMDRHPDYISNLLSGKRTKINLSSAKKMVEVGFINDDDLTLMIDCNWVEGWTLKKVEEEVQINERRKLREGRKMTDKAVQRLIKLDNDYKSIPDIPQVTMYDPPPPNDIRIIGIENPMKPDEPTRLEVDFSDLRQVINDMTEKYDPSKKEKINVDEITEDSKKLISELQEEINRLSGEVQKLLDEKIQRDLIENEYTVEPVKESSYKDLQNMDFQSISEKVSYMDIPRFDDMDTRVRLLDFLQVFDDLLETTGVYPEDRIFVSQSILSSIGIKFNVTIPAEDRCFLRPSELSKILGLYSEHNLPQECVIRVLVTKIKEELKGNKEELERLNKMIDERVGIFSVINNRVTYSFINSLLTILSSSYSFNSFSDMLGRHYSYNDLIEKLRSKGVNLGYRKERNLVNDLTEKVELCKKYINTTFYNLKIVNYIQDWIIRHDYPEKIGQYSIIYRRRF